MSYDVFAISANETLYNYTKKFSKNVIFKHLN